MSGLLSITMLAQPTVPPSQPDTPEAPPEKTSEPDDPQPPEEEGAIPAPEEEGILEDYDEPRGTIAPPQPMTMRHQPVTPASPPPQPGAQPSRTGEESNASKTPAKPAEPAHASGYVLLFGEGGLRMPALTANKDEQQTTAAAGAGLGYEYRNFMVTFSLRKGSEQDIEVIEGGNGERTLGTTFLDPQASSLNYYMSVVYYPFDIDDQPLPAQLGVFAYFTGGGFNWNYSLKDDPSTDAVDESQQGSLSAQPMGFSIGPSLRWTKEMKPDNCVFFLHAGYALRLIAGDAGFDKHDDLRKRLIGTTQTTFHGFEVMPGASLGKLTLAISFTYFFKSDNDVEGLTRFRFTPVINAFAPFRIP